MINNIKYIVIFFALMAATAAAVAQPKATVQFFGGYAMPLGSLKGTFGTIDSTAAYGGGSADSLTYLMKSGLNYGLSYKKPLTKNGNLNLSGTILFSAFRQAADFDSVSISRKLSLFSIAVGAEWQFMPKKKKINPSIAAEIMGSFFSGSVSEVFPSVSTTTSLNSTFRLGLLFSAGVDFAFHQSVGVYAGAKYAITNLIGKNYGKGTTTTFNLNDKSHDNYPDRTISYFVFNAGVSFYFGK